MIKIELYNIERKTKFLKYFETEFERDKFIRRLRYSKKLILINDFKEEF